jgi:hypothetical protein
VIVHLRELVPGERFVLLRTWQKFVYLGLGPSPYGGFTRHLVRREYGNEGITTMHHSCHVKPLIRVVTGDSPHDH